MLLLFRATEELVALHGCQVIHISSSLQPGGFANHTFEINLLLVLLVIHLPIPTSDRLSLDVEPLVSAPLSHDPIFHQPIADLLLHHVNILKNLLLPLLARHVHQNEVLDISLFP